MAILYTNKSHVPDFASLSHKVRVEASVGICWWIHVFHCCRVRTEFFPYTLIFIECWWSDEKPPKGIRWKIPWTIFYWKITFIDGRPSHFLLFCRSIVQKAFVKNIWLKTQRLIVQISLESMFLIFWKNSKFKYFQIWKFKLPIGCKALER